MRRLVLVPIALALAGAGALVATREKWLSPTEPPPRPRAPLEPPAEPATTPSPASAADVDASGLEPAEAAALHRVWLLHGNAQERARAAAALAALGAAAPSPAAQPPLASMTPSAAWEAHAARQRGVDETLDVSIAAHAKTIDALRERWTAEIRGALPPWERTTNGADEHLALARLADAANDHDALVRSLLSAWRADGETGRVATTWLFTTKLDAEGFGLAAQALTRIRDEFEGEGRDASGRILPYALLAESLVDRAARVARAFVEGPAPMPAEAKRALAAARDVAAGLPTRADGPDLDAAARYVALGDGPFDLAAIVPGAPPSDGPRIVVFTDDFQLGETLLASVLRRWQRGIRVVLVGRLTGKTRSGIRRVPVASEEDERATLSQHAKGTLLSVVGFVARGGTEESRLGLARDAGAVVFVLDATSRVVARAAGNGLDPRPLDPVVARLVPDATLVAPPTDETPR